MASPAARWAEVHRVAGKTAFERGWPRSWNPHPVGSTAYSAWKRGWLRAQTAAGRRPVLTDPDFTVIA